MNKTHCFKIACKLTEAALKGGYQKTGADLLLNEIYSKIVEINEEDQLDQVNY